jgi:hypothetical protein
MAFGVGFEELGGYPFEVRYSRGSLTRARAAADVAADAYVYFSGLFSRIEPDIAVIVADSAHWHSRQPYGLPFFNDDEGQIRPGIVVMPASRGEFWIDMARELREASPHDFARLLETYPDGAGGVDLQPFFDLITLHELGHAFEVLGGLHLPRFWLGEIFANLCLHTFIAVRRPEDLGRLETLSVVGARSTGLADRMRANGYSTLEQLEAHYTGGDQPMSPLNYVWYQYRWQRIAAAMFDADGEGALARFWQCFHEKDRLSSGVVADASLVSLLASEVSAVLGHEVQSW